VTAEHAAAMAHADQVFASAEKQIIDLVGHMDGMRAEDPHCARVDQWMPLMFALKEIAADPDTVYAFLAAAILRLSEAGSRA
jgi:hypothetical protein